jgi:hypothetical protein
LETTASPEVEQPAPEVEPVDTLPPDPPPEQKPVDPDPDKPKPPEGPLDPYADADKIIKILAQAIQAHYNPNVADGDASPYMERAHEWYAMMLMYQEYKAQQGA